MGASYERGLAEVGDGIHAYLQPDGGWGWSNAGLISDGDATLLIDTLFDLKLTETMLAEMRRAVPAAARIDTLVNTHANGDHCYGNQLLAGARIVASERTAAEMQELPPAAMAALVQQAPNMGTLGDFFLRCFEPFDFTGIEPAPPGETFSGELSLRVGSREVRLLEVGPAHTRGDTLAWLPAERVLFTGDILFKNATRSRGRGRCRTGSPPARGSSRSRRRRSSRATARWRTSTTCASCARTSTTCTSRRGSRAGRA
jgi:glyoxylase-like metal-dependent hydrolase (beta-lactamase superfamily II)